MPIRKLFHAGVSRKVPTEILKDKTKAKDPTISKTPVICSNSFSHSGSVGTWILCKRHTPPPTHQPSGTVTNLGLALAPKRPLQISTWERKGRLDAVDPVADLTDRAEMPQ